MGKKSKRRQMTSSAKGCSGKSRMRTSNPMAETQRIRTNEDGQLLTDAYYRFSCLIRDIEGVGVIYLNKAVKLYTDFRLRNQFLSVMTLLLTIQKCLALIERGESQETLQANQFIITLLEDHEDFVKRHVSIDDQFFLYHKFVKACTCSRNYAKLCSYSEGVFPYLLEQSEEKGFDRFETAKAMMTYANVCTILGKYSEGQNYYDEALLIWKEPPPCTGYSESESWVLMATRKTKEASILASQAELALIRSIAEQKKVTKKARKDSINNLNEASKLYQEIIDSTIPECFLQCIKDTMSNKLRCHLSMAVQYGKLKQWDDAEEHFDCAMEIGKNYSTKNVIGEIRMWIGRLYFDRYIHNSTTVADNEQNDQDLIKAQIHTTIAGQNFRSRNLIASIAVIIDYAHQSYFLGDVHKAINNVTYYLKSYMNISTGVSCNACYQNHTNREVKHYCKACNTAFYCNRVCQYQDWRGENEIHAKHMLLCPLVQSWKKLCKKMPEVKNMASQDIEPVIKNTIFEDMFKCYFESLRK